MTITRIHGLVLNNGVEVATKTHNVPMPHDDSHVETWVDTLQINTPIDKNMELDGHKLLCKYVGGSSIKFFSGNNRNMVQHYQRGTLCRNTNKNVLWAINTVG